MISYNLEQAQVLVVEATALHKDSLVAIQQGIKDIHIEGDNFLVINTVNNIIWSPPWQIA